MTMENKKFAVITGASSGIGYELARVFAKNGYDLLICAEDEGIIEASNAFRALGGEVDYVKVDLSTPEGVEKLYARIEKSGRDLDAIALNAGVGVSGEFINTDLKRELKMLGLNVASYVHLTKLVLPQMVKRGRGRILFTSSIAATAPGPYYAVYAATKAFIQSFAEAIRHEVKDHGVVVTSLQPGPTDTQFFERADMLDTPVGEGKKDDPATVAEQGFKALMEGRDHVVAGSMRNNLEAVASKFISEKAAAKMQADSAKPNSLK
jgi:short-subunit dehydrogenase